MSQTEQTNNNLSEQDSVFIYIKNILQSDANLCNFARYIDFGKITKSSDGKTVWTTQKCILNGDNTVNNNQIVRFVTKLDTKFIVDVKKQCDYEQYGVYNDALRDLDTLYNNVNGRKHDYYSNKQEMQQSITNLMLNIDCNYKITGSSLTAFDFVCKNPEPTSSEYNFYTETLYNNLTKLIFVGDKCYLLAIADRRHRIYVSTKILCQIYKKDTTENKDVFKNIVTKLFNVITYCCVYLMNHNMTQYFNGILMSPLVAKIYDSNNFTMDKKISLNSLKNFTFSDEVDTDEYVRQNIIDTIKSQIESYINKNYYIDNIDYGKIIRDIRENVLNANKHLITKAYVNGVMLNKIFTNAGWNLVTDVMGEMSNYTICRFNLNPEHVYIYKDLDFVPSVGYVYTEYLECENKINGLRKIKSSKLIDYKNGTGFFIHRLYLDITTGVLVCDGKHPNISNGSVCMGDLKGKVVFTNSSENEIIDLLDKCEKLLTCINYTSSYTSEGRRYFCQDDTSYPYDGIDDGSEGNVNNKMSNNEIVDFADITSDDIEEVSDNTDVTQTTQNNNTNETSELQEVNSEDFEEVE